MTAIITYSKVKEKEKEFMSIFVLKKLVTSNNLWKHRNNFWFRDLYHVKFFFTTLILSYRGPLKIKITRCSFKLLHCDFVTRVLNNFQKLINRQHSVKCCSEIILLRLQLMLNYFGCLSIAKTNIIQWYFSRKITLR